MYVGDKIVSTARSLGENRRRTQPDGPAKFLRRLEAIMFAPPPAMTSKSVHEVQAHEGPTRKGESEATVASQWPRGRIV